MMKKKENSARKKEIDNNAKKRKQTIKKKIEIDSNGKKKKKAN